jgi:transcriptional regulator of acetoin/glycerol metabolism
VKLSPEAGRTLLAHDWPLNVRELNQALSVALALAHGTTLEMKDLPASVSGAVSARQERDGEAAPAPRMKEEAPMAPPPPIPQDDASLRALVLSMLERYEGNVSDVSRALGKTRMQIHRWMKRFDIDPAAFRK